MSMQGKSFGNQLTDFFRSRSLLSILVIANVAVWVVTLFFPLVDYLFALAPGTTGNSVYGWLALSSQWQTVLTMPWTLLTYMFVHSGLWHILFNMVMLYFGGTMFCRYVGSRRLGWAYFISGIAGGLLYLLVYNLFPVGNMHISTLVGASAAVLGVFVAVATYIPNQEVSLWLIRTFTVKMKYVAIALVIIDLLSISSSNAGGHIAHLGGALTGFVYIVAMRQLQRRTRTPRRKKTKQAKPNYSSSRPLSDDEYNRRRASNQKRVDAILDKISKSGYDNLTKEEKDFLFNYK